MKAFYKITQKVKDILMEDPNVHTVLFGVDNYRDLYKKVIYPVAHINPVGGSFNSSQQNVVTLEIAVLDQRDLSKNSKIESKWLSNDNQIDTLNTAHAVLNRLCARLRWTDNEGIELLSVTEPIPVIFRELDLVDGWMINITLAVPNTIDVCVLPEDVFITHYFSITGYENQEDSCEEEDNSLVLYSKTNLLGFDTVLYTDSTFTTRYAGDKLWHKSGAFSYNINDFGLIIGIFNCSVPDQPVYRLELTSAVPTKEEACLDVPYPEVVWSFNQLMALGIFVFEDEGMNSPYPGGDMWYKDTVTAYSWRISDDGEVMEQFLCPASTDAFGYTYNGYDCDCNPTGSSFFTNNTALTVGKWFYHPDFESKIQITNFDGMFSGTGDNYIDANGVATCAEVICPIIPFIYTFSANGRSLSGDACADTLFNLQLFTTDFEPILNTTVFYLDSALTTPFVAGGGFWYKNYDYSTAFLIDSNGTPTESFVCPCARPEVLVQKVFIEGFTYAAPNPCGDSSYNIVTAPNLATACEMYSILKNCQCGLISGISYSFIEFAALAVGEKVYNTYGSTSCTDIPLPGFHFFLNSTNVNDFSQFCEVTSITIVTTNSQGIITAIDTCNYAECRPAGMHQAFLLASFGTHSSSPCGTQTFNIQNAPNLTDVCGMWTNFKNCVCPAFPISSQAFGEIEYIALTPGNKLFLDWGSSDCNFYAEPGFYFLWDSMSSVNLRDYFCPLTAVTIITVGALGVITDVTTCTYTP